METQKRKYQKHKTDKKITIKHFLNNKLKGSLVEGKNTFPLYVQVIANELNTTFRSAFKEMVAESDFDEFIVNNRDIIDYETSLIDRLVREFKPDKKAKFRYVTNYLTSLSDAIDYCIKFHLEFLIARTDSPVNYTEEQMNNSDRGVYELAFILNNRRSKLINWEIYDAFYMLNLLPDMICNVDGLLDFKNNLFRSVSFETMFKVVSAKYFHSQPFVGHWQFGDFQNALISEYSTSAPKEDINLYISLINSLLEKHNHINRKIFM